MDGECALELMPLGAPQPASAGSAGEEAEPRTVAAHGASPATTETPGMAADQPPPERRAETDRRVGTDRRAVGQETYIAPLVSISESLQIDPAMLNTVAGQTTLYKLRDDYIPIVRLCDLFNIRQGSTAGTDSLLVVVEGDGQKIGVVVDELLGQQQVVIKSLETNFKRVEGVSGATILGDGTVALIPGRRRAAAPVTEQPGHVKTAPARRC